MLYCFLHRFLKLLQTFPSLYTVFLILSQLFFQFPLLFLPFPVVTFFSFVGFHCVLSCFFLLHASYHFHRFPLWLFVPFPLVSCISCIFNIFFQEFYPSPSVSDRFCTISSGCYRIFLHFHCLFPACLLHRHSLFLAVAPVSSMFQQILHPLFWLLSHFPARLLSRFPSLYLSSIFQWILHDFLWLLSCFPAVSISSSWVFSLFMHF